MALKPINDLAKVEIASTEGQLIKQTKETSESGILVELPDKFMYFGFWSFAFEDSFVSEEKLAKLYEYWKSKIGYKVYWTALSEKGSLIKQGDKTYAFIKLTSLIAVDDDPQGSGRNLHGSGAGAFKV